MHFTPYILTFLSVLQLHFYILHTFFSPCIQTFVVLLPPILQLFVSCLCSSWKLKLSVECRGRWEKAVQTWRNCFFLNLSHTALIATFSTRPNSQVKIFNLSFALFHLISISTPSSNSFMSVMWKKANHLPLQLFLKTLESWDERLGPGMVTLFWEGRNTNGK